MLSNWRDSDEAKVVAVSLPSAQMGPQAVQDPGSEGLELLGTVYEETLHFHHCEPSC